MTDDAKELINIINSSKNPEQALITAINIIKDFIGSDEEE
jgi:hypothetical protein